MYVTCRPLCRGENDLILEKNGLAYSPEPHLEKKYIYNFRPYFFTQNYCQAYDSHEMQVLFNKINRCLLLQFNLSLEVLICK